MPRISETSVFILMVVLWSHLDTGHSTPSMDNEQGFRLRIVHTNNMLARFEEISPRSGEEQCREKYRVWNECAGGFARIATIVREARNSTIPTIFLNAGNTYHGTDWYSVHKWKIVSVFLNLLQPDAMSLGNHEFDDGVEGLVPFINAAKFPIVAANLDLTGEPELAVSKLTKHTILNVNGTKIGIIGYLTPETKNISSTGNVNFLDEVESIKREVAILRNKGVNILIALGSSGYEADKKIATEVDGLDIVIGGYTYTVSGPDGPTTITQSNGRKVCVTRVYPYTQFLGDMIFDFDGNGEIAEIVNKPKFLDHSFKQAEDVLAELEKWRPGIEAVADAKIGATTVLIVGGKITCRTRECNFGNLIADAMIDYRRKQSADERSWTDASIAILNSGTINSSIKKRPGEEITMNDLKVAVPQNSELVKIMIPGSKILEVLEWSVRTLDPYDVNPSPAFLQLSGIKVIYDLSKPVGSRVHSVQLRCSFCLVPSYEPLKKDYDYGVLVTDFTATGSDGYNMLANLKRTGVGATVRSVLIDYIKSKTPVHPRLEGRILYLVNDNDRKIVSSNPAARLHRIGTT